MFRAFYIPRTLHCMYIIYFVIRLHVSTAFFQTLFKGLSHQYLPVWLYSGAGECWNFLSNGKRENVDCRRATSPFWDSLISCEPFFTIERKNKNWYKPDSCLFVQRSCCTPPGDWRLVAARRSLSFSLSPDTPTVTSVLRNLLLILNMNSIRILLWCICLFFFISTGKLFVKLLQHVSPSNSFYTEFLFFLFTAVAIHCHVCNRYHICKHIGRSKSSHKSFSL